jgi:DNA-binding FadR family transcriptional regulator
LPGDAELMQQFGVSRTVLREALRTLAGKGLIEAKARVGTRVLPRSTWNLFDRDLLAWQAREGFDSQFVTHLSEMRLALEPEAAALAALRRTNYDLETIFHCFDRMAAPEISREEFAKADLDFHLAIVIGAHNPFLRSAAALIEVALMGLLKISSPAEDAGRLGSSVEDHRRIADAIAARDPDSARETMKVVIGVGMRASRIGDLAG